MRRSLLALVASIGLASLSGCVVQPHYAYSDNYYGDYYYEPARVDRVAVLPDYFAYSAYYSALWPVYCPWWDAFCDSFHYGVTYFPHRYFGVGFNYGFAYSPWYGSWWDNYYDWNWWHDHRHQTAYESRRRFGSAQNEARAVALLSRDSAPVRGASLRAAAQADAAAMGAGATLRSRSTPLRANGDEPLRRDRMTPSDERTLRDPYYGMPVRRSASMSGGERLERRVPDDSGRPLHRDADSGAAPFPARRGVAVEGSERPTRRGDATSPRAWPVPRDDVASGRGSSREDAYSAPRQESSRFVPREPAGAGMPSARSAPAMPSAPAPVVRSAPPPSSPPARASRDDGGR